MMPSTSEHTGQASQKQSDSSGKDAMHATTPNAASPGAQATARWRERRRLGSLVVSVELFKSEVEVLVQLDLLPRAQAHDRGWIGLAVERLVERVVLRRTGSVR